MKHIIIANPVSGNHKGPKHALIIQKLLNKNNINSQIIISKYRGHITKITKELSSKEQCRFYSIGGDGTLNEVVNGVIGTNSQIVVVPCGTGNDFARSISDFSSIRKIINNSINSKPTKTDVIKLNNGRYCINVLNAGFDAIVAKNIDKFRRVPFISGKSKYNLSIFYTLLENKHFKFKIRFDKDYILKGNFTLVAICNGKYYGGGICPAKHAKVNDGILNVCTINPTRIRSKIKLLPKYKNGKHEDLPDVHMNDCKNISIVSTRKFPVSIDGEIIYTNKLRAQIIKEALNVIYTKKTSKN